jgi:hypothetical protein
VCSFFFDSSSHWIGIQSEEILDEILECAKKIRSQLQKVNELRVKYNDSPVNGSIFLQDQKILLDSQIDYEKRIADILREYFQ